LTLSILPTKIRQTLPGHKTKSSAQLFCFQLYIVGQKDERKNIGMKAARKMMMKLASEVD